MEKIAVLLAKQLSHWGVNHIFGIPGKPVVPLILAAEDQGISFVLSKHEGGAGYEAAGYAMLSRNISVAVGTSGPGATNLLTAAAQAKASHLPVLFITGHPSITALGKPLGQDSTSFGTDTAAMFSSVTKFSTRIDRADNVESILAHAVRTAFSDVKGPVHLSIPADVLMEEARPFQLALPEVEALLSPNLKKVYSLLKEARRPMLLLGKGVHSAHAYEEITAFAEIWNIPAATTPGGKGTFMSSHPLSLGAYGLGGTDTAHTYVEEGVDTLIVFGSKLSDMSTAGWKPEHFPEQIIHFDADITFIGKSMNVPVLPVLGDLRANLRELLKMGGSEKERKEISIDLFEKPAAANSKYMSAAAAMKVINTSLPPETILFGDDGSHTFYAIKYYQTKRYGGFYFDDVFGAMGHGIGYAVGAKLASPEETIVCLTGDGCMFMHGSEVATAVEAGAAVLFLVLNNQALDMVDKGMKVNIGRAVGTKYNVPLQAAAFAASLGADALTVSTLEELQNALQDIFPLTKPLVVEMLVDPDEIPPTMRRG
ncbi:thiamine pyrophosphate-binding protein [Alkalicoccus daliensis]|uniref:Acetolactate synthase-1/2/3 large subunit n=1 Tax=Alkalicoccus daliensis TaxID=745820 RepID=A0A1H0HVI3_9BACI|nr:thiamine pyrophosphate-binding protein [Alkalicoccus daliensis]SDO23195.1 acetolactate synthase-1/2/3 large subunit [Alkalicoccus daliensis]